MMTILSLKNTSCGLLFILTSGVISSAVQAATLTHITASNPTAPGSVMLNIKDTNSQISVNVNVPGILGTDTPVMKAAKINTAINNAINNEGQPISDLFSSNVAGNKVTITKTGGGGMAVNIIKDTTGEGTSLKIEDSAGNANNRFWRFVSWVQSLFGISSIPPSGQTYELMTTNGFYASVTTDGKKTVSDLQNEINKQLEMQGVLFTSGFDPEINQMFFASQYFPVGESFPIDGVGIDTKPGYGELGGIGVELQERVPEPDILPLTLFVLSTGVVLKLKRQTRQ